MLALIPGKPAVRSSHTLPAHSEHASNPERRSECVLTWKTDSNCEGAEDGLVSEMAAANILRFAGTSPADPGQYAISDSCAWHFSCCNCALPPGPADAILHS